jgi:tetratricopeptide (TPR) repeat protein
MLERFWFFGDHLSEARSWYSRVLDADERVTVTKGLAMALVSSGCVALNLEHIDEAQASLEQSAGMWKQLGEPKWLAWSLEWLGYLLLQRGEAGRAGAIYAEHEALFRATGDGVAVVWVLSSWGIAKSLVVPDDPSGKALLDEALLLARTLQDPFCFVMCYSCLGDWAVLQGDHATARRHFLDALEWRRHLGTRWIIAAGLWQVANMMRLQGDFPEAEPMYAEALALARELGDQRSEAHIAQELGVVAIHLGDIERATTLLAGSLSSFRKWADPLGIARCLLGFAVLLQTQRRGAQAARVLGFVEPWLQSNGIQLVHFDHTNYVRSVAAARTDLGREACERALAEGREMTLEQAVAYARGHIPA